MFNKFAGSGKKTGFNKYTVISFALIALMVFFFKDTLFQSRGNYPEALTLNGIRYEYTQAVKESFLKLDKSSEPSDEGYRFLIYRKDKKGQPSQIFIYIGGGKYRAYKAVDTIKK